MTPVCHEDDSTFADERQWMIDEHLIRRGISDQRVLDAMNQIPRELFVPHRLRGEAYEDWPLPIGFGQTISQPFTVAYMAQTLRPEKRDRVLEIGTGSGYAAAVLSCLAGEVFTVERIASLADRARDRLSHLGYENVHVFVSDGTLGLHSEAPFDAISSRLAHASYPCRWSSN